MPAKTVLFDQRVNKLHDFGTNPRNFLAFNPQGRLLALAGFGNLAGKIDIFDRRTLSKICEIDAPNTSWCEWSPDGRLLLTATLSPRLRVDNGIKIWHCTGPLMHVHLIEELYQASWRPDLVENAPPFGTALPPAPTPSNSVESYQAAKPTPSKPAGAYRPPGARGSSTPSIFKRQGQGTPRASSPLPSKTNGAPAPGRGLRGRVVPGAPPPGWAPPEEEKRPSKKKNKKQDGDGGETGPTSPAEGRRGGKAGSSGPKVLEGVSRKTALAPSPPERQSDKTTPPALDLDGAKSLPINAQSSGQTSGIPLTPGTAGEGLDPIQKKIRNLNKKLKAIEELKEKVKKGDKMEATQLKKIEGEADIKKELAAMMAELSVSA